MKKIVVKIDLHDDRDKQKAMKAVSSIAGIDQIAIDMGKKELTVIGDVDPVDVVTKLRKHWHPEILTVGPAKEPEKKKEEPKKEEPKKEEKKEEKKGGGEEKKKDPNEHIQELVKSYQAWNPQMTTHYHVSSMEENPNTCTIC